MYEFIHRLFYVTLLTSTVPGECVSIITQFTLRARLAISVIQALEALAGSWVTWLWVLGVNVPVALARPARPARLLRITIVTRSAAIAAWTWDRTLSVNLLNENQKLLIYWLYFTCISFTTLAEDLIRGIVCMTGSSVGMSAVRVSWTRTGATVLARTQHWVTIEPVFTPKERIESSIRLLYRTTFY